MELCQESFFLSHLHSEDHQHADAGFHRKASCTQKSCLAGGVAIACKASFQNAGHWVLVPISASETARRGPQASSLCLRLFTLTCPLQNLASRWTTQHGIAGRRRSTKSSSALAASGDSWGKWLFLLIAGEQQGRTKPRGDSTNHVLVWLYAAHCSRLVPVCGPCVFLMAPRSVPPK